jgi:hypothetical protein
MELPGSDNGRLFLNGMNSAFLRYPKRPVSLAGCKSYEWLILLSI